MHQYENNGDIYLYVNLLDYLTSCYSSLVDFAVSTNCNRTRMPLDDIGQLKSLMNSVSLILLCDGYDEVLENYDKVNSSIAETMCRCKIIVASRVESSLSLFTDYTRIEIAPLNVQSQEKLLFSMECSTNTTPAVISDFRKKVDSISLLKKVCKTPMFLVYFLNYYVKNTQFPEKNSEVAREIVQVLCNQYLLKQVEQDKSKLFSLYAELDGSNIVDEILRELAGLALFKTEGAIAVEELASKIKSISSKFGEDEHVEFIFNSILNIGFFQNRKVASDNFCGVQFTSTPLFDYYCASYLLSSNRWQDYVKSNTYNYNKYGLFEYIAEKANVHDSRTVMQTVVCQTTRFVSMWIVNRRMLVVSTH